MNSTSTSRPWGRFEQFTHNQNSTVKLIYINKGQSLSLQYHNGRDEFWKIVSGHPMVQIGETKTSANPGDEFECLAPTHHRVSAPTDDVVFLEISTGDFDEKDVIRLEDIYDRS